MGRTLKAHVPLLVSTLVAALGRRQSAALVVLLHRVFLTLVLVSFGCASTVDNRNLNLPAPIDSTTLGPGDVFELEVVGEKELPKEYVVASDGTVNFPYVHRVKVEGLEPNQIEQVVQEQLIAKEILTNPSVIVKVKEYNSKRVTVLGQVQKPGSFPLSSGLTLIQVISLAGGFNSIANRDRVSVTRKTKTGTKTVVVNVDSMSTGRSDDILLQSGDSIFVHERVF